MIGRLPTIVLPHGANLSQPPDANGRSAVDRGAARLNWLDAFRLRPISGPADDGWPRNRRHREIHDAQQTKLFFALALRPIRHPGGAGIPGTISGNASNLHGRRLRMSAVASKQPLAESRRLRLRLLRDSVPRPGTYRIVAEAAGFGVLPENVRLM